MNKIVGIALCAIVILSGLCTASTSLRYSSEQTPSPNLFNGTIRYVGGDGPGNYTTIQSAINDCHDGDTVFIYHDHSPYYENVQVDKSIQIIGENKWTTIIDGGDPANEQSTILVTARSVKIEGLTIQRGLDGINLRADRTTVTGNVICNSRYPLKIIDTNNHMIIDNIITNCSDFYVHSMNTTISSNNISYMTYMGIYLDWCVNCTVSFNFLQHNYIGVATDAKYLNVIRNNTILDTDFSAISIGGGSNFLTISGNKIERSLIGIETFSIYLCQYMNVTNNIITNCEYGMTLIHVWYSNATNNVINNCVYGMASEGSSFMNVTNNVVNNNVYGITLNNSQVMNLTNNVFKNCNLGINLTYSKKNLISHNDFVNNDVDATFIKISRTKWYRNYWEQPRDLPKIIKGTQVWHFFKKVIKVPWINFDFHPAQTPNTI